MGTFERVGVAILVAAALSFPAGARAQTGLLNHSAAEFASDEGNLAYLGLGVALPLVRDGKAGTDHALRTADSLGTATLISEGLKLVIHEERPDRSGRDSFPSGHATAAFAVAAMESHYHRAEGPVWYLGAALIADSRVTLHRHYPHDVIVGGLIGVATSLFETAAPHGLLLSPFIRHDGQGKAGATSGVHLSFKF